MADWKPDSARCIGCSELIFREYAEAFLPFRCPPCAAEKKAEAERQNALAAMRSVVEQENRRFRDSAFDAHRRGQHRLRRHYGCPACDIQYSPKMQPQADSDEVPRGLR